MFKNFSSLSKSSFKSPFASFKTTSNYSSFFNVTYNVVHVAPTLHNRFLLASFATKKEPKKGKKSLAEESVSQVTRIVKKAKEKSSKQKEPEKKATKKLKKDVEEKEKAKIQKEKEKEKEKQRKEKEKILAKKKEQKEKLAKLKEKEKQAAAKEKAQKAKEKEKALAAKIKRKQEKEEKQLAAFQYKEALKKQKEEMKQLAPHKKALQKAALKQAARTQEALARPVRRSNSFIFFAKLEIPKMYAELKQSHPKLTREVRKKLWQLVAQRWAALSPEESLVFKQQSNADGERAARELAQYKQSLGPKRPPSAFMLFLTSYRGTLLASNPNISPQECAIRGGEAWRALAEEEKKEWFQKSAEMREQWFKAKAERKNASVQETQ